MRWVTVVNLRSSCGDKLRLWNHPDVIITGQITLLGTSNIIIIALRHGKITTFEQAMSWRSSASICVKIILYQTWRGVSSTGRRASHPLKSDSWNHRNMVIAWKKLSSIKNDCSSSKFQMSPINFYYDHPSHVTAFFTDILNRRLVVNICVVVLCLLVHRHPQVWLFHQGNFTPQAVMR